MRVADKTLQALATSLNFRQMRQELISSNVANAETPGYKAKRLSFEDALARALNVDGELSMNTNDPKHYDVGGGGFENLEPTIEEEVNGIVSEDGNNVDRDKELALMAENEILYDTTVQLLNKKLALMKYAIQSER
ncbi:MAG: flagellar basal body rod protein FlgB [Bdellovibrionales bacterium CG12_big_fil_rev_8_21_14_0_65_38_15]|nr:MAG: flagellar basal body rod protein FlgB [Bdellovibrionales bacterium CG22_combo_CG10-13_8_21_14_all_38_13]PIQ53610.1 MAG: flagellar basal body rod protein FlgB [Bdellovibrionales bacterium CG12_big_fil_rev_8_21_14_0_65_38_15]PIR30480.1 MAG: flagellar basal body rod protein FlgB [Bdellovibrionales bacterium CG11_big_fil_rev_8_21_14_0_20_38_13]